MSIQGEGALGGKGGETTFRMEEKIVLTDGRVESTPSEEEAIGVRSVSRRGKMGELGFAQTQNPFSLFGKKDETKAEWLEVPSGQTGEETNVEDCEAKCAEGSSAVVEVGSTSLVPILEKISTTDRNESLQRETSSVLSSSGIILSKSELGVSSSGQTMVCRDSGDLIGFLEEDDLLLDR